MNHIDVSSVLRRTVCELYSNLVTRSTGAAVRTQIELQLEATRGHELVTIDFSHVGLLDFSCADEVVAKLLLRYATDRSPEDVYFVFRGLSESHRDAVEAVLERHALALVIQLDDGATAVLGQLSEDERRVWESVSRLGLATEPQVAAAVAVGLEAASRTLERLCRRRLLMRLHGGFTAVGMGGRP